MVREVPSYLLVKLMKAEKMPHKSPKRHPRILALMILLYKALFD